MVPYLYYKSLILQIIIAIGQLIWKLEAVKELIRHVTLRVAIAIPLASAQHPLGGYLLP